MPCKATTFLYRDILKKKVIKFLDKLGRDYRYQQDNVPMHTAKIVNVFLMLEGVLIMNWPAESPDFSVTKYVWTLLKRSLSDLLDTPTNP